VSRKVERAQNVSRMCVVCGVENGLGLQGHFYEVEGDEVVGVFQPRPEHQGYPDRMHGGLASASYVRLRDVDPTDGGRHG
jgi:hypothetical protein